jgi:hypothetical protein
VIVGSFHRVGDLDSTQAPVASVATDVDGPQRTVRLVRTLGGLGAPLRVAFSRGMRGWDLAVDLGCRVIVVGVGGSTAGPTSEWDSHGEVHGLDLR